MTKEELLIKIKETYGTYSRFCREAGLNRYEFQRDFLQARNVDKKEVARIGKILAKISDRSLSLPETAKKLESLRKALKESGGVPAFCRKNPKFKAGSVYGAMYGHHGYTNIRIALIKLFKL